MNVKTSHRELKGGTAMSWPDHGGYGTGNLWQGSSFCLLHFWSMRLASGSISIAQHFLLLHSGFFACKVQTKEDLLAQTTEECCYGALGKSWFVSGKLGAGAGWSESRCAHQSSSALMHAAAPGSMGRNEQLYMPQVWILPLRIILAHCMNFFPPTFQVKLNYSRLQKLLKFDLTIVIHVLFWKMSILLLFAWFLL